MIAHRFFARFGHLSVDKAAPLRASFGREMPLEDAE
jgi:hypothetical protein